MLHFLKYLIIALKKALVEVVVLIFKLLIMHFKLYLPMIYFIPAFGMFVLDFIWGANDSICIVI